MEEKSSHKFAPLLDNETTLDLKSFNNLLDEVLNTITEQGAIQPSLYQSGNDLGDEDDPFWGEIIDKVNEIITLKQIEQIKAPITMKSACLILNTCLTPPNQDNSKVLTNIFSNDLSNNYVSTSTVSLLQIRRTYFLMVIGHPISAEMCNDITFSPHWSKRNADISEYSLLILAAHRGETEVIAKLASQAAYPKILAARYPVFSPVAFAIRKGIKDPAFNMIALQLLKITDETKPRDKHRKMRSEALTAGETYPNSAIGFAIKEDSDLTCTLLKHTRATDKALNLAATNGHLRQVKWILEAIMKRHNKNPKVLARVNAPNWFRVAIVNGHDKVVEYLISQSLFVDSNINRCSFTHKKPTSRKLWLHQNLGKHWSLLMVALNNCKGSDDGKKSIVKQLLSNNVALEYRIDVTFNHPKGKPRSIRMNAILGAQMHNSLSLLVECIKATDGNFYQREIELFDQYARLFSDVCTQGINTPQDRIVFVMQTALIQHLLQITSNDAESQDTQNSKIKNTLARWWQGSGAEGHSDSIKARESYDNFLLLLEDRNQNKEPEKMISRFIGLANDLGMRVYAFNVILYKAIKMDPACAELCGIKLAQINTPVKHSSRFIGGTVTTSRENENDDNNNNEEVYSGSTLTPQGQSDNQE